MYVIFSAGIYIEEKSMYVPLITGTSAVVNIATNLLLIPVINISGAAVATFLSYLVMAFGYYFVTQKFYKIDYELVRIGKIFFGIILASICYYVLFFSANLILIYNKTNAIGIGNIVALNNDQDIIVSPS